MMKSAGQSILVVDKNITALVRLAGPLCDPGKGTGGLAGGQSRAQGRQGPDGAVFWRIIT